MKIQGDGYNVNFDQDQARVAIQGTLRLGGMEEYQPIFSLLQQAVEDVSGTLTIDMRELQLLNSSGITMLSKFVIGCRSREIVLTLQASKNIPWQAKSLKNLQRLLPSIVLDVL